MKLLQGEYTHIKLTQPLESNKKLELLNDYQHDS